MLNVAQGVVQAHVSGQADMVIGRRTTASTTITTGRAVSALTHQHKTGYLCDGVALESLRVDLEGHRLTCQQCLCSRDGVTEGAIEQASDQQGCLGTCRLADQSLERGLGHRQADEHHQDRATTHVLAHPGAGGWAVFICRA